jgi:hypothetical protein
LGYYLTIPIEKQSKNPNTEASACGLYLATWEVEIERIMGASQVGKKKFLRHCLNGKC